MIFEFIVEGASKLLTWFISLLPQITIPEYSFPKTVLNIINAMWYFLPMPTIFEMLKLGISITLLRWILAIIIRVKSFIPLSGGS